MCPGGRVACTCASPVACCHWHCRGWEPPSAQPPPTATATATAPQVIRRYVSGVYPLELEPDIVAALALSADESSVAKMGVFAVNASKRANATAPHARAF